MEQKELTVELRTKTGKGISRQLRMVGRLPGVVYGKNFTPVHISIDARDLRNALTGDGGSNNLLNLKGCDELNGCTAIVADLSRGTLKGEYRHVDLHKVDLLEKLKVKVPVNLIGTPVGAKEGGMLDFSLHEIELECLPTQIPEHFDVDVTELTVGHSIHISDLQAPAGMRILDDPKISVVSILGKARGAATTEEQA